MNAIRKVIREEVENETTSVKEELGADMRMSRIQIQNDVGEFKDRIKKLEIRITSNHKEIKKEMKQVVDCLDKQDVKVEKRVSRIEKHPNLPQN